MSEKVCTKCKGLKSKTCFGINRSRADGLQDHCGDCRSALRLALKERKPCEYPLITQKFCKGCSSKLPADMFYRKRHSVSGLGSLCKKCESAKKANRPKEHKQKQVESTRAWKLLNPEKSAAADKAYRKRKPEKKNAREAKRRSAKISRTPKWLTEKDIQSIKDIYAYAKMLEEVTGVQHHVDHIFPLQGEFVCGLHCPLNLQILSAADNLKKHNKWNPGNDFA